MFKKIKISLLSVFIGLTFAEPSKLLQKTDLIYKGAFRVPEGELGAGGSALVVGPDGKSIFITSRNQKTAEIYIPDTLGNDSDLYKLPVTYFKHNFIDALENKLDIINPGDPNGISIGGALVYNSQLILTSYAYYDAGGTQKLSHFSRDLELTTPGNIKGPVKVGGVGAGFVSGYMQKIPSEWVSEFGEVAVTGQCCLPIISRTSAGPSLSLFNPDKIKDTTIPAIPLVYYDTDHQTLGSYGDSGINLTYNGSTNIAGVVWAKNTASVLFIGTHGIGPFCYGEGTECGDKADGGSKGNHAYPYKYQVWAYKTLDLLSAKNGQMDPWEIKPYAVWNFNLPYETDDLHKIGSVTYDLETNRIYMTQLDKDDGKWGFAYLPIIHVFEVNGEKDIPVNVSRKKSFNLKMPGMFKSDRKINGAKR